MRFSPGKTSFSKINKTDLTDFLIQPVRFDKTEYSSANSQLC